MPLNAKLLPLAKDIFLGIKTNMAKQFLAVLIKKDLCWNRFDAVLLAFSFVVFFLGRFGLTRRRFTQ